MLRVENLTKKYGNVVALNNVNLSVDRGEYVAIVGPSGCGKTTLIKMISGIEKPTSGRVFLNGKDVTELPTSERKFGYVFQNIALFPHMKAGENIAFPLKVRNLEEREQRRLINEFAVMLGIEKFLNQYPRELPTGTQQSCGVARALATQNKLMLLDEPLSALDARVRKKLRMELRKFMKDFGVTVIHVTHDQEEALAVADKVCVMRSGEILEYGTAQEVYRNPRTLFGAFFVGEMNFIFGKIQMEGENVYAITECGDKIEVPEKYRELQGEKVVLAIRPENVRVKEKGLEAEFRETVFFGSYLEHRFSYCGEKIKMVAYTMTEKFNNGEKICLHLPKDKISVYRIPEEGFASAISLEKRR
ncbi:MAG: ABC transporter ATP-binding protein [Thermoplasmata archaeon]